MRDLFFERVTTRGTSYAEFRFSAVSAGYVMRIGDAPPEIIMGAEAAMEVESHVARLTKQGYKPTTKPSLPGLQTPETIAAITGHTVPARYAKFLAEGPHPSGTVDGI